MPFKVFTLFFVLCSMVATAQLPLNDQQFFSRIKPGGPLPEKLLATRTAVFYPHFIAAKDLETMQTSFQRAGIDAVIYFENDLLMAGRDVSMATAQYLITREIANLVFVQKKDNIYSLLITTFNQKANFVEQDQPAWDVQDVSLEELLRKLYRAAVGSLKKENFLINDFPETSLNIEPIKGRRSEFFGIDLKVDPLAVPRFNDAAMDTALAAIMKEYPFKYKFTDPNLAESDLRKQGLLFVLRFVHARDKIAKTVMGYDMTKSESAIVSITYPGTQSQVKNIPADTEVFKFYFKHIDSGNVYLGTKWDADDTWQQALINQLRGLKAEMKIP
ncbi:hypothetical protein KK083_30570 [Fulvivirgaceae bacterium PWU4]|uniref:TPM domain-containing protein n=1 Tax=Chryseosolibacter histidini TaxID=2782349 RepID=A0AAP2DRQ1_9BACT|nr:hypothetical protein [Chryseosolibacter histidini]MBT1701276.1 hypothetical protein [Chryseosolibacter histidini]